MYVCVTQGGENKGIERVFWTVFRGRIVRVWLEDNNNNNNNNNVEFTRCARLNTK